MDIAQNMIPIMMGGMGLGGLIVIFALIIHERRHSATLRKLQKKVEAMGLCTTYIIRKIGRTRVIQIEFVEGGSVRIFSKNEDLIVVLYTNVEHMEELTKICGDHNKPGLRIEPLPLIE